MLEHVRLPLLTPKFLVGVVGSDPFIHSDERCRDLVDEAKNYMLLPQERPLMQGPRTRPRRPITREVLFAVGGKTFDIEIFCVTSKFDSVLGKASLTKMYGLCLIHEAVRTKKFFKPGCVLDCLAFS